MTRGGHVKRYFEFITTFTHEIRFKEILNVILDAVKSLYCLSLSIFIRKKNEIKVEILDTR